jgi:tetratricopeptide (TPR) repeat protein
LLAGQPGIGKTRLAAEIGHDAARRGAAVLWGRCWEGGGAPAYWPWVQIVRAHAPRCPRVELARQLGAGASLIAEIVPELRELLPDLPRPTHPIDSEEARFRLFDATGNFFRNASRSRALLLVLDDLQWADEPSLVLLQFLSRGLDDSRVLLLGAYRDVEAKAMPTVARRIAALTADAQVISLRGLGAAEVRLLVEASGGQPGESMADAVHRATGGNPLFVLELVRLVAAEGRPAASVPIPERVREVIRRRAALVSADCRRILAAATVIGRDFDPAPLLEVCQMPRERLHALLSEAHAAELVVPTSGAPGRFSFSHDLVRETLYDDLAYDERLEHHRLIADTLERLHAGDLDAHAAEVAWHLFEAIPLGTADRAVEFSTRAGDRAAQQLAHEDASVHYERALQALARASASDEPQRCRLWLSLGDARWWAGRLGDSRAAFRAAAEIAEQLGAAEEFARAAFGVGGRAAFGIGDDETQLIGLLERALSMLDAKDSVLRAVVLARLSAALAFTKERTRGVALAACAVDMARRIGDRAILHLVLNISAHATWRPDNLEERLALSAEAVRLRDELGDAALVGSGSRIYHLLETGDLAAAEVEAEIRSPHALRCRFCAVWAVVHRAGKALLEGRLEEVEGLNRRALAMLDELQNENGQQFVVAQRAVLRREEGRLVEIADLIRTIAERYPALRVWRAVLAWTYVEGGRPVEAGTELERLATRDFADIPRDLFWLATTAILSEVVAALGDAQRAEPLYAALQPFSERYVLFFNTCLGSASRALGILATTLACFDAAAAHFEEALQANARLGARPWVAHTQHEYARMLVARDRAGDREQARELLAQASHTARQLGMASLFARVEAVHRSTGRAEALAPAAPPATGAAGPSLLFRREGEYWTVADHEIVARMRDAKGLRYIAALLREPGRELYAGDLLAGDAGATAAPRAALGDAGPRLDDASTHAYRARLAELREQLEEAEANNDTGRAAQARTEMDFLARELASAIGLGGRRRRAGAAPERARLVVTKAIRASLKKVERNHPRLGRLLARTIRTGTFCSYRPDPDNPVEWQL